MANIGYIQVNRHCNNGCHFCSNPSNGQSIDYERGIFLIDDFIDREYQGIIFTGGEPTLSSNLPRWIEYASRKNMDCRIISNGMMCSDLRYTKRLADAGLKLAHFSVYSREESIHDFLTDTPGSWKRVLLSIHNALQSGIRVQINMVINHYNENHLDVTVKFLTTLYPQITHFVWNNLDPLMMRKTEAALSTLPDFNSFAPSLDRAMQYLQETGRTFRVERVPLCFMRGFEFASTETRKIVKEEERVVYFLDERDMVRQHGKHWQHDKPEECSECDLSSICAGVYEFANHYSYVKVQSQQLTKKEKENIISLIQS